METPDQRINFISYPFCNASVKAGPLVITSNLYFSISLCQIHTESTFGELSEVIIEGYDLMSFHFSLSLIQFNTNQGWTAGKKIACLPI